MNTTSADKSMSTSYLSQMQDVVATARSLMVSTLRYSLPNLKTRKDRLAYIKAMRQCIYLLSMGTDLYATRSRLRMHKVSARKNLMKRTAIFSDVNGSYQLACTHAIAIMDSMILRFLEGGCDPDTRFIQTIGEIRC